MSRPSVFVAVLFGLAGCGAGPGTSDAAVPRWHLALEHTLGTLEEGPAGFGDIRGILVDRRGYLWVLDFAAQEVRVFDTTGAFVRTVGRRGQGPGEFIYADGLAQARNGVIWVHDPQNNRLSGFSEAGEFAGQVGAPSMGYGYMWSGGADSAGRIWEDFFTMGDDGKPTSRYRRYAADMARVDTVDIARCTSPAAESSQALRGRGGYGRIPFTPLSLTAIDFNGRVACVPWSAQYAGVYLRLDGGDTLGRFQHTASMIPIATATRDSEVVRLTDFAARIGADFQPSMIPTEQPALQRLYFDDEGRLWARRITASGGAEFDRFDATGKLEATIESPVVPGYPAPVFRGDRVYFVASGPDDEPVVLRLRLERRPATRR